jgi:hypothetical protein
LCCVFFLSIFSGLIFLMVCSPLGKSFSSMFLGGLTFLMVYSPLAKISSSMFLVVCF